MLSHKFLIKMWALEPDSPGFDSAAPSIVVSDWLTFQSFILQNGIKSFIHSFMC